MAIKKSVTEQYIVHVFLILSKLCTFALNTYLPCWYQEFWNYFKSVFTSFHSNAWKKKVCDLTLCLISLKVNFLLILGLHNMFGLT